MKLSENFFVTQQYIGPSAFKILYPYDDYFKSYREKTMRDIDKIPFLAIFRNFSVVFRAAFKNYCENRIMTSSKYHLDAIF